MEFPNTYQQVLTIPTGATTGARIVINGITGTIQVYNSSNVLVDTIGGSTGAILSTDGSSKFVELNEGQILVGPYSGGTPDEFSAAVFAYTSTPSIDYLSVISPIDNANVGHNDQASMLLQAGAPGIGNGGSGQGNPAVVFIDELGTSAQYMQISGAIIKTGLTGTSDFVWHPAVAAANFSIIDLQYRLDAEDNVIYLGQVTYTGLTTSGAGAQIITTAAPANYRPKHQWKFPVVPNSGSGVTLGSPVCQANINTDGTVGLQYSGVLTNGTRILIAAQAPLGNIA